MKWPSWVGKWPEEESEAKADRILILDCLSIPSPEEGFVSFIPFWIGLDFSLVTVVFRALIG